MNYPGPGPIIVTVWAHLPQPDEIANYSLSFPPYAPWIMEKEEAAGSGNPGRNELALFWAVFSQNFPSNLLNRA